MNGAHEVLKYANDVNLLNDDSYRFINKCCYISKYLKQYWFIRKLRKKTKYVAYTLIIWKQSLIETWFNLRVPWAKELCGQICNFETCCNVFIMYDRNYSDIQKFTMLNRGATSVFHLWIKSKIKTKQIQTEKGGKLNTTREKMNVT